MGVDLSGRVAPAPGTDPVGDVAGNARKFFEKLGSNLWDVVLMPVKMMTDAITQGIEGLAKAWGFLPEQFRDAQLDLINRVDLLSSPMNYCTAFMDHAHLGNGWMDFNKQIGPARNVELYNGGLRLKKEGLWDIRALVSPSWVVVGLQDTRWELVVLTPDDKVFSKCQFSLHTTHGGSSVGIMSVVTPAPNYVVKVNVWQVQAGREIRGNPMYSRLTAQQVTQFTNGGVSGKTEDSDFLGTGQ